jgi:gamma-glutamylcyclotransferase (GGCT)/AIG2-like uncharacterized protein YtfP
MDAASTRLEVFVYGTLKRDQVNHASFCRGAAAIEEAWTLGRLFHLAAGYPALEIVPGCLLDDATGQLAADLALQERWQEQLRAEPPHVGEPTMDGAAERRVFGERVVFDDPDIRLPRLDRLEGFRHGRRSLYRRVLILTWTGREAVPRPAWTYVQASPQGTLVPSGRWPG